MQDPTAQLRLPARHSETCGWTGRHSGTPRHKNPVFTEYLLVQARIDKSCEAAVKRGDDPALYDSVRPVCSRSDLRVATHK